jgi:copper(I)-binding protein
MRHILGILTALALASASHAHGVTAGDLEIIHPSIPAPPASTKAAGGHMGIRNDGDAPDRLIGVEMDAADHIMLHTTEIGSDGVARMIHLDAIELPPGETVLLQPGGLHVMMMGLRRTFEEGDMIPATLVFERAGRVEVEFAVEPREGLGEDHGQHGSGSAGD